MERKMLKKNKLSELAMDKLLAQIKEHPCLYDCNNPNYHERYTINKSWNEISAKMGLQANFLKAKWKNVRDMYIKCLKKCKTPDAYRGTWRYFDQLRFLGLTFEEASEDSDDNVAFETLYDDESPVSEVSIKLENDTTTQSFEEDPIVPTPEKKRKVGEISKDDEEYDLMFLKSLLPYFKKLDTMRKLVVRSKIQDMLMNELAAQRSEGFKRVMGDV